jgi:hypothetical protein
MPTPPPVDVTQRYPQAIRDFVTYINQDGQTHTITSGGTTTDLTLDAAAVTRDLETEIVSLEQTLGAQPFLVPGQPNIGLSISWLSSNLSPGHIDARNAVNPLPPPSHSHPHQQTSARSTDDHPQYMLRNGARPFTAPVTAPGAVHGGDLINLAQAKNAGLTWQQVQNIIQSDLQQALTGILPSPPYPPNTPFTYSPVLGPTPGRWKMAGGWYTGYTDENGIVFIDFGPAAFSGVQSFVYMKMPFPGTSYFYGYKYQYEEDQLILLGLSTRGALVQFIEDVVVDRRALVAMTWMCLGV